MQWYAFPPYVSVDEIESHFFVKLEISTTITVILMTATLIFQVEKNGFFLHIYIDKNLYVDALLFIQRVVQQHLETSTRVEIPMLTIHRFAPCLLHLSHDRIVLPRPALITCDGQSAQKTNSERMPHALPGRRAELFDTVHVLSLSS